MRLIRGVLLLAGVLTLALGAAWCARPAHAECAPFGEAEIDRIVASGLTVDVVEGAPLEKIVAALREHVDFDEQPTRLVLVYNGAAVSIALIVAGRLCNIINGPAAAAREIVHRARGGGVDL